MPTRRWDPFQDLIAMHRAVFGEEGEPGIAEPGSAWAPPVDVFETGDMYILRAEVPGVDPDSIHLEYKDNRLVLTGERAHPTRGVKHHQVERPYGPFLRQFVLPDCVNCSNIEANLDSGVLEVKIPKRPETAGRSISVKS